MENERKTTEKNEGSVNTRSYEKEYRFLDQTIGYLKFELYEKPVSCETHFYSSLARYIDLVQKENPNGWEAKIQEFINSIKNFSGSEVEKLKYVDSFFRQQKANRYRGHNMIDDARIIESTIKDLGFIYSERNDEGKIDSLMNRIPTNNIPERFYPRFTKSGLEKRVQKRNRDDFISAMRYGREQADKLKDEL